MSAVPFPSFCPLGEKNDFFLDKLSSLGISEGQLCTNTQDIIEKLQGLYHEQRRGFLHIINSIKNDEKQKISHFIQEFKAKNYGVYPALCLFSQGERQTSYKKTIFLEKDHVYSGTITHVDLFKDYLQEQLDEMFRQYSIRAYVGRSQVSIPFVFLPQDILQEFHNLSPHDTALLKPLIHLPHLGEIHDDIPNGQWMRPIKSPMDKPKILPDEVSWADPKEGSYFPGHCPSVTTTSPLMSFSALRVDYSLGRLRHYCGTAPEMFQHFVLLTNYQRYIDGFFAYAQSQEARDKGYTHWCEPKDQVQSLGSLGGQYHRDAGHTFQMPAYHLMKPGNMGITMINIGVSPSNAKTITDHLAVLRGHCWMMLGHCGGFDPHQVLGDYVLAKNYMRADHVLDADIPKDIPIPICQNLHNIVLEEAEKLMGLDMCQKSFHQGTVLSTGNRNWELHLSEFAPLIHRSRSIAIDMESTTLGANAYRFMVPYGTLLCISDRPLHGELKLHENAKNFYNEKVQHHLRLGIYTMESLGKKDLTAFHQENYRGIYAPPLR